MLMVISIDSMLIKQLEKLLNVILQLVLELDKMKAGFNSILPIVSFWPNQSFPIQENSFCWVDCPQ